MQQLWRGEFSNNTQVVSRSKYQSFIISDSFCVSNNEHLSIIQSRNQLNIQLITDAANWASKRIHNKSYDILCAWYHLSVFRKVTGQCNTACSALQQSTGKIDPGVKHNKMLNVLPCFLLPFIKQKEIRAFQRGTIHFPYLKGLQNCKPSKLEILNDLQLKVPSFISES